MKKLGLSLLAVTAMFFYSENVNAQVEGEVEAEVETHAQEQSDFKEIDVVALPQPVKDAVMSDFNGAVTEEAWVKEKDGKTIYKLSLNVEGEKKKVYVDQDGNWIDKEDKDK
ncbi:hypothetical protein [Salegentibacter sediminis]|uniref:hypothetical protein n=1 Tax=Salegentibacter sediminis TaxID=1930251 RepID=UPI0009BEE167|nr:hypothetical protein [Salegentibacter sediminis]